MRGPPQVAGAAAAEGRPLGEVRAAAEHAAASVASMGAALSFCSLPGAPPQGRLPEGTMELGLGIHGEAGALRCPVKGADGVVGELLQRVLKQPLGGGEAGASPLAAGDAVALLVNNLGATTAMELHIVLRAALRQLQGARLAECLQCARMTCPFATAERDLATTSAAFVCKRSASHGCDQGCPSPCCVPQRPASRFGEPRQGPSSHLSTWRAPRCR